MGNDSFYDIPAPVSFHEYHGRNIILSENNTRAYRTSGYAYGITFSKEPILPGEIFLFEIEKFEHGWLGNLRCGLTQKIPSTNFKLPQNALPDLINAGQSWISPISVTDMSAYGRTCIRNLYPTIYESNDHIHTSKGSIPVSLLQPSHHLPVSLPNTPSFPSKEEIEEFFGPLDDIWDEVLPGDKSIRHPADVGSRIGITYVVRDHLAEMYLLINGDFYGPCATSIPYRSGPLYAVIDLYGTTKQVRIVQTCNIPSLKNACREKILQLVSRSNVFHLPLPKQLIDFLTYMS